MIICPYCNKETYDEEFCDNCGKFLCGEEVENKVQDDIYKYKKTSLECITFTSNIIREDLVEFNCDSIQNPIYIKNEKLYFIDNDEVSLEEFLDNNTLNFKQIIEIIKKLCEIFKFVEERGYIIGSINLSDFWIKDSDISKLFYRQTRRLLKEKDTLENYEKGDICSPEISNENIEFIDKKTDVYLIGRVFINLSINKKFYIDDYEHERYVGYNLSLFNKEIPKELHQWIGKSTSIFSEERYESVNHSIEELFYLFNKYEERLASKEIDIEIEYDCITNVGENKVDFTKVIDLSKVNEDSFLVLNNEDKLFAMVSDGVSNCSYGCGYDASNIIKDVCNIFWEEQKDIIVDKESTVKFISDIIIESNKRIFESVKNDLIEEKKGLKGIMAATFSAVVIIKNTLYYVSLGDSPIYLLNKENITRLNNDDNYGNNSLVNGLAWSDYKNLEEKSSLIKFIGGKFALQENISESLDFKVNELKLLEDDLLIICSDGLTDYINPISARGDIWSKDNKLRSVFLNEGIELKSINENLVNIANENGGGDNITIILLKININNNREDDICQEN